MHKVIGSAIAPSLDTELTFRHLQSPETKQKGKNQAEGEHRNRCVAFEVIPMILQTPNTGKFRRTERLAF